MQCLTVGHATGKQHGQTGKHVQRTMFCGVAEKTVPDSACKLIPNF